MQSCSWDAHDVQSEKWKSSTSSYDPRGGINFKCALLWGPRKFAHHLRHFDTHSHGIGCFWHGFLDIAVPRCGMREVSRIRLARLRVKSKATTLIYFFREVIRDFLGILFFANSLIETWELIKDSCCPLRPSMQPHIPRDDQRCYHPKA